MRRIIGDIGGTNARFAWLDDQGRPTDPQTLVVANYDTLADAVRAFAGAQAPRQLGIAVACPVADDRIKLTNNDWCFSKTALAAELGLERLDVINDFTALALALPHLSATDTVALGGGEGRPGCALAVLGPGTGLGVSGLLPVGGNWVPVQGEGGHVTLAVRDPLEVEILKFLTHKYGRVSAERALCGAGLVDLYLALAEIEGLPIDTPPRPADVTAGALSGDDPLAVVALNRFCAFLGDVAGDVALTLGAYSGVYLAGGIVPRFVDFLADSQFRTRFEDKGRFAALMRSVPVRVVTAAYPGLVGAAAALSARREPGA